jgi:type I restriction enzyme, S subunit
MSQLQLPSLWKISPLQDLAAVKGGRRLPKGHNFSETPTPYPYLRVIDFVDYSIATNDLKFLTSEDRKIIENYIIRVEDVYISIAGTIGRVGTIPVELDGANLTENAARIIIKDRNVLDKHYLVFYLSSARGQTEIDLRTAKTSQPKLAIGRIQQIPVVLPPLPEQSAIAHTLRTIQKAKEARQRELELERERKAALMQYLFTHGTRNEPRKKTELGDIPQSWQVVKLGKVCKFLQYGTSKKCDLDSSGLPVLRIPNVIGGKIDTGDLKFVKLSSNEVESLMLKLGDLLFVRTNGRREYTGRCAVFSGELQEALFASYLIRARLDTEHLLPEFAQFYTMTYQGKKYLSERASSASDGKFNINTQTIKSVLIPKPDIDEQGEIINALQASDTKIAALEQEAAFLDELFRAMLEELMTGRLSALPLVEEKAIV